MFSTNESIARMKIFLKPTIKWFDNGCAGIICSCGRDLVVGDERKACECGNRYTLVQEVKLEQPTGRCWNCNAPVYHSRSRYCSETCGNEYRAGRK